MKPYGVKRNWNATEDYVKNGGGVSPKTHTMLKKKLHRAERRRTKHRDKLLIIITVHHD